LNLLGPLGPLSAGVLGWVALSADLPGVALLAAAYAGLTREQERTSNRLRSAIVWGFVGWVVLSAYWRFLLPLTTGTDVQDLFAGLLGANPGTLALAKKAWASVEEIFVAWIAAAGLSAIAAAGVIARDTQPPAPDTYQGMIHAPSG